MSSLHAIEVTAVVHEYMVISVNDFRLYDKAIDCEIRSSLNEIVRRGRFKGGLIQLRLINLIAGQYSIVLKIAGLGERVHEFKKVDSIEAL